MPRQRRQTLLRTNRRALAAGCVPPALLAVICLGILSVSRPSSALGIASFAVGGLFLVFSVATMVGLFVMACLPRVAVTADHLLVYLRGFAPYQVPLDAVECFFQGQGPAEFKSADESRTTNVVVRLAERATDWHDKPVKRPLGEWSDGYIVIRGTWCEPISETKLRALNSDLASVKRRRKGPNQAAPSTNAR